MKKVSVVLWVGMILLLVSGCKGGNSNSAATAEKTTDKVEIRSADGKVTVPKNPQKVVVFDNSALDTMDALGVGEKVVGVAAKNLPSFLKKYQSVESAGGIKEPDLEKINALKPDLIIISGRQKDFQAELAKIAPTVYFSTDNRNTWSSIKEQVQSIATIFDKQEKATQLIGKLQQKIDQVKTQAKASHQTALLLLTNEGSLAAYGKNSRFGIVHDTFGFAPADEQIKASTHGQSVSYEYIVKQNPAIIFMVDRTKVVGGDLTKNQLTENELVKQTAAGKNGKIIQLDSAVWYLAGSGLQSVAMMLSDVETAL